MADKPTTKLSDVKTKTQLPDGTFLNKAETIKKTILKHAIDKNAAIRMINFYINRAGSNLQNKKEVMKAKKLIENCRDFSLLTKRLRVLNFSDGEYISLNYQEVESKVKQLLEQVNDGTTKLQFLELSKDKYNTDVLKIWGGLNGSGDWSNYFLNLFNFLDLLERDYEVWLIGIKNDCADDVFDVKLGIRNYEVNKYIGTDIDEVDGKYIVDFWAHNMTFPSGRTYHTEIGIRCIRPIKETVIVEHHRVRYPYEWEKEKYGIKD